MAGAAGVADEVVAAPAEMAAWAATMAARTVVQQVEAEAVDVAKAGLVVACPVAARTLRMRSPALAAVGSSHHTSHLVAAAQRADAGLPCGAREPLARLALHAA